MRVYIPATFSMLGTLNDSGVMPVRAGWGFALTPALQDFYTSGDEEEISFSAFQDAAEASLRLLAIGDETQFPHRRVVVSADVPEECISVQPQQGAAVLKLTPPQITKDQLAAIHIDSEHSESATAAAIEVIDMADMGDEAAELTVGDALDNYLAFYDPTELPFLIELM